MREKIRRLLKIILQFMLNPRLLLCFGIGWIITNGWAYVMLGLGTWLGYEWMIGIAGAYIAFLWLPVSAEKVVTFAIAMVLLRWLFPNDQKTLGILKQAYADIKETLRSKKQEHQKKKQEK
jgi:hypothetical protein